MALLTPDRYFSRITAIDIEADLLGRGYRAVLLDIDNTSLTRDTHEVPRDVRLWLARAREAGTGVCLVSNNWHASVHALAGELDLPIVAKAMKPVPASFMVALRKLKAPRSEAVVVGDQLATDVLGAHLAGLPAYMLQPLVEQDLPHTLLLRNAERVILGDRKPEPAVHMRQAGDELAASCAPAAAGSPSSSE